MDELVQTLEEVARRIVLADSDDISKWTAMYDHVEFPPQQVKQISPSSIFGSFKTPDEAAAWFQSEDYDDLLEEIKADGIQEPLEVFKDAGKIYIVDGWHRLACAQILGFKTVPVVFGRRIKQR